MTSSRMGSSCRPRRLGGALSERVKQLKCMKIFSFGRHGTNRVVSAVILARARESGVKTRSRFGKWCFYWCLTKVRLKLSNRKLGGRNGESAMTRGVIAQDAGGGHSVRIGARVRLAPRPSLGSSQALLLLLSCPEAHSGARA